MGLLETLLSALTGKSDAADASSNPHGLALKKSHLDPIK